MNHKVPKRIQNTRNKTSPTIGEYVSDCNYVYLLMFRSCILTESGGAISDIVHTSVPEDTPLHGYKVCSTKYMLQSMLH